MTTKAESTTTNRRPLYIGAGIVGAVLVAVLAFGYFGVQALFIDDEVDEAGPVFASGAGLAADTSGASAENSASTDGLHPVEVEEPTTDTPATDTSTDTPTTEADEQSEPAAAPVPDTAPPAVNAVTTIATGSFVGLNNHVAEGTTDVLNDGSEQRFLRFSNFNTTNGPDLNVYLRADDGSFIDLGDLKGNIGDQNYEIPVDVDLSVYNRVEIWCVRFSTSFGEAALA